MPNAKSPTEILRALALRHADVEETIACKGTAVESASFKIRKKTFLLARDVQMMLKLDASLPEAKKLATADPAHYKVGAPWVTVNIEAGRVPPRELLTRWIAESYQMQAAPAKKKSR